ncbi:MAG: hypothetical protein J6Y27_06350 [Bacteroidales bacterium]|jgi:hypothetical protein|nr:hypothetical protein [Bacteroidales bacterium]MBR0110923.1 hypothetical protein [Bacteroidales bacterium]
MARRKKNVPSNVDPDFLLKQKAAQRRNIRQVIYFNAGERSAIDEYCRRLKISSRSALLRQIIMERLLTELDEHHPTLF